MALDDRPDAKMTVAMTLALAEAWNERGALLSTLAFQVSDLFGAPWSDLPPPYLVRRLTGGASAANPELVEAVRAELFLLARRAREEARRLLDSTSHVPCDEESAAADLPPVDFSAIQIPQGGDDIAANPDCPPARRRLGGNGRHDSGSSHDGNAENTADEQARTASVTPLRPKPARRSR